MALYFYRAVANGFRTDHPIPDLPFVNDSHIPVDDAEAVEAVGRGKDEGMWGREDPCPDGGWVAYTTDPIRRDLAWCVRWHPEHGRSVVLYRNTDGASVHTVLTFNPALLFRAGGYWWDGTAWYRPGQVWDRASETYVRRPVPASATVYVSDLLASAADPGKGQILQIIDVDADAPLQGRWLDDLALWAARRTGERPLSRCVASLTASELTGDQLVGMAEMATIGGVADSTLRAYISRSEGDVPLPQATVGGRSMWARPVAEEWAEQRRRSPESVQEAISTVHGGSAPVPVGVAELWDRFTRTFTSVLWDHPERRKRWALRWRTQAAVHELAEDLGWRVASDVRAMVPIGALADTLCCAVLREFARGQQLEAGLDRAPERSYAFYGIMPGVARMLDWLIRHEPASAARAIGEIIGDAERELNIPRQVSERSLRKALALDGKLGKDAREKFLERVLSPSSTDDM
ncbi:hypothetical protein [Streptosporangium sp. NPDC051022]|uniref:hypothetical protein n=1 Tax=Streptosporangium sp. NPDC051022 TaxID=3155752 RepID=UPI003418AF2F